MLDYFVEFLGWVASIFFAICLAPQAWKTHKEGPKGLSFYFILLTFEANVFMLIFLCYFGVEKMQLYLNPAVAMLLSGYLLYKILKDRKNGTRS